MSAGQDRLRRITDGLLTDTRCAVVAHPAAVTIASPSIGARRTRLASAIA